ncbi:MAG TPA: hypothetical protein PK095_04230, partial [Myxococcota bacterium]|nr:hypothetical protein [Myxococcota bacterium]
MATSFWRVPDAPNREPHLGRVARIHLAADRDEAAVAQGHTTGVGLFRELVVVAVGLVPEGLTVGTEGLEVDRLVALGDTDAQRDERPVRPREQGSDMMGRIGELDGLDDRRCGRERRCGRGC